MIVFLLKEYERPNQRGHKSIIIFETRHTLLMYLDEMMEQQRQNRVPSVWRIETMDLPAGGTDFLQIAHLNELTASNRLWTNLVVWKTGDDNPFEEGGVKKNKKK